MLNIVIPMAGAGSRFVAAGFVDPKPLIPIQGVPMIRIVIHNLRPVVEHRFIFICQKKHIEAYKLDAKLQQWAPGSEIVSVDGLTDGAASTVLRAATLINSAEPLMIANSDQYVDVDINKYLSELNRRDLDGMIMTMTAHDSKWSYVELNRDNLVTRVAEKEVISSEATVGVYNFARGTDFVLSAEKMIAKNRRVNGEFYVAPVYNELLTAKRVGVFNVGSEANGMYGLGVPTDLELFKRLPVMGRALSELK